MKAIVPAAPGWRLVVVRSLPPSREVTEAEARALPDAAVVERMEVTPLIGWVVGSKTSARPRPVGTDGVPDKRDAVAVIAPPGALDGLLPMHRWGRVVLADDAAAIAWARDMIADGAQFADEQRAGWDGGEDEGEPEGPEPEAAEGGEITTGEITTPSAPKSPRRAEVATPPRNHHGEITTPPGGLFGRDARGRKPGGVSAADQAGRLLGSMMAEPGSVPVHAFALACRERGIITRATDREQRRAVREALAAIPGVALEGERIVQAPARTVERRAP